MIVETHTAGTVEVLEDVWYQVSNYHLRFGAAFPVCAQIGIVKYRDSWGIVKTRIGLVDGLNHEDDIRTIVDTGVKFYNVVEAQNDK